MPKISIIIPHHNNHEILNDCLISLYDSDLHDSEIIIVNNNSTDDSINRIKNDFPDLIKRMIQNKLNVMTYNIDGIWLDIGREEDYKLAIEIFKKDKDKFFQSEK